MGNFAPYEADIYCRNLFLHTPMTIMYTDRKFKATIVVNVTTLPVRLQIITAIQVTIFLGYDAV
jgi:hypothetical protein